MLIEFKLSGKNRFKVIEEMIELSILSLLPSQDHKKIRRMRKNRSYYLAVGSRNIIALIHVGSCKIALICAGVLSAIYFGRTL